MPYSRNFPLIVGQTLYAKPVSHGAAPATPWDTDVVNPATSGSGQVAFTGLTDAQRYVVYSRLGLSPLATDEAVGEFDDSDAVTRSQATTAATEIGKVPRASTAIPAGGDFAWNAVTDTANKLTLNVTNEES